MTKDEEKAAIESCIKKFAEQTEGCQLVEVPGDEWRWQIVGAAGNPSFAGATRLQALGAALAAAKKLGLIHG